MRILVVEDNAAMARLISKGLSEQGHAVDVSTGGQEGEELAVSVAYDLVILDVMLPDQDGLVTCRNLRRRGARMPIILLTALSSTSNKVDGLDSGADDYLTKPFELEELFARARALMRRGQAHESTRLRFADLEMDLLTRAVIRSGQKVKLTSKEFAMLEFFLRNPGRVLSRSAIAEHVWGMNFDHESNVIDVYISTVRRKIERGVESRLIHTIIGAGYVLSTNPIE